MVRFYALEILPITTRVPPPEVLLQLLGHATSAELMGELWYNGSPALESKVSKSILHPFTIKNYSGLTINPYQGCQHRCAYCYATYEWSPDFYDKIYAKSNAPEVLEEQLQNWKQDTIGPVMVSSATDCYQPAEVRFGLTRRCIKVLQRHNAPYYVFTKSALIERDLELHRQYREKCFIVWSITTCNEMVRRVIEPGTPPSSRIFATIKEFCRAGLRCAVNVDPIIPLVSDAEQEVNTIVEQCRSAGVEHVFGSIMRLRDDIWERMKIGMKLLGVQDAESRYEEIYDFRTNVGSRYLSANDKYSKRVMSLLKQKVTQNGMTGGFPDLKPLPIKRAAPGQLTLTQYVVDTKIHAA